MVERHVAILLKVGLDWLIDSESLLTLPPFAYSKYYSSNNIINKLCSSIMSILWKSYKQEVDPWGETEEKSQN